MNWLFLALLGPFFWAVVNQADKYLIETFYSKNGSDDSNPGSLVLFSSLFGLIVAFVIFIIQPNVFSVSPSTAGLLILVGLCLILMIILYLYALQEDEVSSVVPWFLTQTAIAYILGLLILRETFSFESLMWSFVILLGAILLSIDFRKGISLKKKVVMYMLGATFFEVLATIIFKFVTIEDTFLVSSFWQYFGLGIVGIIIFCTIKSYRQDFLKRLKTSGKTILFINFGSEALTIVGNLMVTFATLLAPIAIVYTMVTFQAVYVFLLSILFTYLGNKKLTEDLSKRNLVPKIFAIIIMTIGSIAMLY